jgi:phage tail-like protein
MPLGRNAMLGMAMRFQVTVDGVDLGGWASCVGLAVEFKHLLVPEGANYTYTPMLPDRIDYQKVTLTRAMSKPDSAAVQHWLSGFASTWFDGQSDSSYSGGTARVTLQDAGRDEVASWVLRDVYPGRWQGPDLRAQDGQVALETLELLHQGFL